VDFKLTKEQELIQRAAREFAEKEPSARVESIIEDNKVPDAVIRELKELDLFALFMPETYGGAGRITRVMSW